MAHDVKRKPEKGDMIEVTGRVTDACRGDYKVLLDEGGAVINATLAGRMRQYKIRIVVGDKVLVEMSVYDLTRGRIKRRL